MMRARRGFTLIELILAGVIAAFLLGSVSMSLSQLGRAKNTSKLRFDAHIRADAALNAIRKDIASIMRRDDLFFTRFLLINDSVRAGDENFERDVVLVFSTRLQAVRDIDFNGEGFEYETQYRVEDDEAGPALWVRRDAVPDEYPLGGGVASPAVEGIVALMIEAYDGYGWYDEWDSDAEGLPLAVRISVVASGHRDASDIYTAPRAMLRTVVSIDRVIPPKDLFKDPDEEELEDAEDPLNDPSLDQPPSDQDDAAPTPGPRDRPSSGRPRGPGGSPNGGGRPGGGDTGADSAVPRSRGGGA